jgi:bacterioferritin
MHKAIDKRPSLNDIKTLRERARRHIESGAATSVYRADRPSVIKVLSDTLAAETVCVQRCKRHQYMANGINAQCVAAEFAEHATEEMGHADRIAERIAIESCCEIIQYLGDGDPTTHRMMEVILDNEEDHAEDRASLLECGVSARDARKRSSAMGASRP